MIEIETDIRCILHLAVEEVYIQDHAPRTQLVIGMETDMERGMAADTETDTITNTIAFMVTELETGSTQSTDILQGWRIDMVQIETVTMETEIDII